jgi:hypothetical protein
MAQTVEEILQKELGQLVMQISIKEHLLQKANERIKELEDELASLKAKKE